jgi:GT2 family glycosyltransferase
MSFRKNVFRKVKFSTFFEGYGLYEDLDFCLRASRLGPLYLNTSAQLEHHHEPLGRPNKFRYGRMVIRNGWYVWRLKYPQPSLKAKIQWHATALLLTGIRLGNAVSKSNRKEALLEGIGRLSSWFILLWNKPKIERN